MLHMHTVRAVLAVVSSLTTAEVRIAAVLNDAACSCARKIHVALLLLQFSANTVMQLYDHLNRALYLTHTIRLKQL
jgi:hypothetical protein